MAAAEYYHNAAHTHTAHSAPSHSFSAPQHSPLRPMLLVDTHHHGHDSLHGQHEIGGIQSVWKEDKILKTRIRRLRLVTRILAFLVSVAVFIPITLTLHKFLTTKDTFRDAPSKDGGMVSRTAWAKDTKSWPTYMYFAVAAIALILNAVIIISYLCGGTKSANKAATISTFFGWVVMIGNLVVWSIAASLYRTEKDKDGKPNDLWGWSCSAAAKEIQHIFKDDVNFDQTCHTQSASFYAGIVQVAVGALTIITYLFVIRRRKVKKVVQDKARLLDDTESFGRAH